MLKWQCFNVGVWRSWLARKYGVLEAAGSSPATPTILSGLMSFMLYNPYV